MKLKIRHANPKDFGALLKIEAHIRFMNAMWYSNKHLSLFAKILASLSAFAYFLASSDFFTNLKQKITDLKISILEDLLEAIKNAFTAVFGKDSDTTTLYEPLIYIICISIAYILFGVLIKRTIENNYHYQRVREIVSVLHVYDFLNEEQKKQGEKTSESAEGEERTEGANRGEEELGAGMPK